MAGLSLVYTSSHFFYKVSFEFLVDQQGKKPTDMSSIQSCGRVLWTRGEPLDCIKGKELVDQLVSFSEEIFYMVVIQLFN
jgi:hypothetical protein